VLTGSCALVKKSEGTSLEIGSFYSCDAIGNPQFYFPTETTAYFNVTLRNFTVTVKNMSISLSVLDELNVPVGIDELDATIPPDSFSCYLLDVFIPKWAFVGNATAQVLAFEERVPLDSQITNLFIDIADIIPPRIHIHSPENKTYTASSIPLTFTIEERTSVPQIAYCLDHLENMTIMGNTTLTDMPNGSHNITVYANDTSNNMGYSSKIYFTVFIIHDIAAVNVTTLKTVVGQQCCVRINATTENQGAHPETFNITIYANTTHIQTKTVTLTSGNSATIIFIWNTTGIARGNYTITAYAIPVPGETNTRDNTISNGWIIVATLGDVTGPEGYPDGVCDIRDIGNIACLLGLDYPHPLYNPNFDIYPVLCDGKIDLRDLSIAAKNFGKTNP